MVWRIVDFFPGWRVRTSLFIDYSRKSNEMQMISSGWFVPLDGMMGNNKPVTQVLVFLCVIKYVIGGRADYMLSSQRVCRAPLPQSTRLIRPSLYSSHSDTHRLTLVLQHWLPNPSLHTHLSIMAHSLFGSATVAPFTFSNNRFRGLATQTAKCICRITCLLASRCPTFFRASSFYGLSYGLFDPEEMTASHCETLIKKLAMHMHVI